MIHLIRNTFRYAPRQYWDELSRDLKPVHTAPTEAVARERFGEFEAKWATKYPAIGAALAQCPDRVRPVP